jgi:signal transduction histidine kinase
MNAAWPERSRLRLAALAAGTGTAVALAVRVLVSAQGRTPHPNEVVLVLIAAAALCVVGLAWRRDPSAAWLGCVVAATFAYLDLVAAIRTRAAVIEPSNVGWLLALTVLAAVSSVGIASTYATARPRRLGRWVAVIAGLGVALVVLTGALVVATTTAAGPDPAGEARDAVGLMTRTVLLTVLAITTLGILGDLRPAVRRTSLRLERESAGQPASLGRRAAIFVDELAPGRHRADRAAAEERTRIAADLHAHVVPPVRRALEAAEHGGTPEELVATLRTVLADVDAMATERHSVTLEALGLIAALEQLAERVEDRSDVRISIDVPAGDEARAPRTVEAAAFRIAQLALDNVVRHAPGADVRIEVAAATDAVRLIVTDDGPGLPADREVAAAAAGRRGLADMRIAANACGGSLAIGRDGGAGTSITFAWPPEASVAAAPPSVVARKPQEGTSPIPS